MTSLSDKRNGVIADGTFNFDDVKEAIKELKKEIISLRTLEKIERIFGAELCSEEKSEWW